METQLISKNIINEIQFVKEDVIFSDVDKKTRRWKLERAMKLGNLYKHQVAIVFVNNLGERLKTKATIWAVTEFYVILKGGKSIPISCICDVQEC